MVAALLSPNLPWNVEQRDWPAVDGARGQDKLNRLREGLWKPARKVLCAPPALVQVGRPTTGRHRYECDFVWSMTGAATSPR